MRLTKTKRFTARKQNGPHWIVAALHGIFNFQNVLNGIRRFK